MCCSQGSRCRAQHHMNRRPPARKHCAPAAPCRHQVKLCTDFAVLQPGMRRCRTNCSACQAVSPPGEARPACVQSMSEHTCDRVESSRVQHYRACMAVSMRVSRQAAHSQCNRSAEARMPLKYNNTAAQTSIQGDRWHRFTQRHRALLARCDTMLHHLQHAAKMRPSVLLPARAGRTIPMQTGRT